MKDEILDFICRRWTNAEEVFQNGNCYWFARILQECFPNLKIVYFPIEGHFAAYDEEEKLFFDVKGSFITDATFYDFEDLSQIEPNWYSRLLKDCKY